MNKHILFFSCEPGGAEVLIPVIKLLQAQPWINVSVTGYGYAIDRFSKKQVAYSEIKPIELEDYFLFDQHAPNMIITSATSLPAVDMSEKYLWMQAKQRGVVSLAFLDQWQNYAARFSRDPINERLAFLPDWINCINEIGRIEMIEAGFDATKLLMMGHPYLSSLRRDYESVDIASLRRDLSIKKSDRVMLFVTEPIREHFNLDRGYDQYQVLEYFLSNIDSELERPKVLVKLHPKDNQSSFVDIANKFSWLDLQFISNELTSLECLAISDYVFGMSSIMLIEAYVLGKRVASLQPCLRVEDPMVLSKYELIPYLTTFEKFNPLQLDFKTRDAFDLEFRAADFLRFIEKAMSASRFLESEGMQ